eukprot:CAMPEP_0177743934 /NCGR_PEP_ID=MMETSP0484_2-20121128/29460_1 /TAXON_ID=354590 /ORGANISM="Rhodomonas lens, Strain RHODO" /LENGTH=121 /DNA_ID=CAMNT_0019258369 /DNA_START=98 /DNA_END=460 /DNA_ORIENTATION=+
MENGLAPSKAREEVLPGKPWPPPTIASILSASSFSAFASSTFLFAAANRKLHFLTNSSSDCDSPCGASGSSPDAEDTAHAVSPPGKPVTVELWGGESEVSSSLRLASTALSLAKLACADRS